MASIEDGSGAPIDGALLAETYQRQGFLYRLAETATNIMRKPALAFLAAAALTGAVEALEAPSSMASRPRLTSSMIERDIVSYVTGDSSAVPDTFQQPSLNIAYASIGNKEKLQGKKCDNNKVPPYIEEVQIWGHTERMNNCYKKGSPWLPGRSTDWRGIPTAPIAEHRNSLERIISNSVNLKGMAIGRLTFAKASSSKAYAVFGVPAQESAQPSKKYVHEVKFYSNKNPEVVPSK